MPASEPKMEFKQGSKSIADLINDSNTGLPISINTIGDNQIVGERSIDYCIQSILIFDYVQALKHFENISEPQQINQAAAFAFDRLLRQEGDCKSLTTLLQTILSSEDLILPENEELNWVENLTNCEYNLSKAEFRIAAKNILDYLGGEV